MKYIKYIVLLILLISLFCTTLTVFAIDTGLVTNELPNEEIDNIIKRSDFIKITSHFPSTAKCFDVRDDHMIVIGADVGDTAIITVYDNCGNFQYGFETEKLGSFRVMWSGSEIAYYSIRDNLLFKINENGEITDICHVVNNAKNSIYDRDVLLATTRTIDGTTYKMTNDCSIFSSLFGTYEKIIKTNTEGSTIIYDASTNQIFHIILKTTVFLLLSSFVAYAVVSSIKKRR